MTQGLRIWGEDGNLQLDENSFTVRIVHSSLVGPLSVSPAGQYFDIAIAGVTLQNAAAFVVPNGPLGNNDRQLEPELFNGGVRVWRTVKGFNPPGTTYTLMRLIVVRYK